MTEQDKDKKPAQDTSDPKVEDVATPDYVEDDDDDPDKFIRPKYVRLYAEYKRNMIADAKRKREARERAAAEAAAKAAQQSSK